jgi:signal transduction histidine kinase/DNA-binding LacI/PurR family transcriptional regulator
VLDLNRKGRLKWAMAQAASRKPTIGLVVTYAGNEYAMGLARGVAESVFPRGGRVVLLAGGVPSDDNPLYGLLGPDSVDGVVVATGMFTYHFTPDGLGSFVRAFAPLSVASIAVPVPGVPSVLVDNAQGTREAVRHLVEIHGKRSIAFIEGDPLNPEMIERRAGYEEGLRVCGIAFDPAMVVGPHDREGRPWSELMTILREERQKLVEAIVTPSDALAIPLLRGLIERGVDVPDDILLIGFDDDAEIEWSAPALTTVRQPLAEQARKATDHVFGLPTDAVTRLPVSLVVRRSCGCMPSRIAASGAANASRIASLCKRGLDGARLLAGIDRLLRESVQRGDDPRTLQALVTDVQESVGGVTSPIWEEARALAANAASGVYALRHVREVQRARAFGEMSSALINAPDWDAVGAILAKELPRLGVLGVYVVVYADRKHPESGAKLLLSCEEDGLIRVEPDGVFDTRELLPPACKRHDNTLLYVVTPLSSRGVAFGYIVFAGELGVAGAYEDLRVELGSLLDRMEREREVVRLHRQEHQRARELQAAYQKLSENKERLVLSEKMASLGRLTAGIAHEMNTPIAAVRTALDEIAELAQEYESSIGSPDVTGEDHAQIAHDIRASAQTAKNAAERIAAFVRGIRAQTRELPHAESLRFDLVSAVREALLLLEHSAREKSCSIDLLVSTDHVELTGDPAKVGPIVRNLVVNAIEASHAQGGSAIRVEIVAGETDIDLSVTDRGEGIAPENLRRVFDPMFTTRGFGDHPGLGLTIVHDLVKSAFAGTIEVASKPGEGSCFTVRLPKNRPISVPPT